MHLTIVHGHSFRSDDVTEEGDGCLMEALAYSWCFIRRLSTSHMMNVFLQGIRANQNIICVNNQTSVRHISEHIIDERLEHRGTIGQPKRHDKIFVVSISGGEASFPFISLTDVDEDVCAAVGKFRVNFSCPRLFECCRD